MDFSHSRVMVHVHQYHKLAPSALSTDVLAYGRFSGSQLLDLSSYKNMLPPSEQAPALGLSARSFLTVSGSR